MIGEYWIATVLDGSDCGLFHTHEQSTAMKDLKATTKNVNEDNRCAGELGSGHLRKRSHKHYGCHFNLIGYKFLRNRTYSSAKYASIIIIIIIIIIINIKDWTL